MAFYSIETGRFSLPRIGAGHMVLQAANAAIWPLAALASRHRKWKAERDMINLPHHIRKDIGYRAFDYSSDPSEF